MDYSKKTIIELSEIIQLKEKEFELKEIELNKIIQLKEKLICFKEKEFELKEKEFKAIIDKKDNEIRINERTINVLKDYIDWLQNQLPC